MALTVEKKSKPQRLTVTLRNLDLTQDGRMHEVTLPLPLLPNNKTADFFRAAGQNIESESVFALHDVVGKRVHVRFGMMADGSVDVVSFMPAAKEKGHAPTSS